jgi:hypothetical protein
MSKTSNAVWALILGFLVVGVAYADDVININKAEQAGTTEKIDGKGTWALGVGRKLKAVRMKWENQANLQTSEIMATTKDPDWSTTMLAPKGKYKVWAIITTTDKDGKDLKDTPTLNKLDVEGK